MLTRVFAALLISSVGFAQTISFKDHGKTIKTASVEELKKELSSQGIKVLDPQEKKVIVYRGFLTSDLFKKIYGASWSRAEEVLFTCMDGYQPSVPVKEFQTKKSALTFEKVGDPDFKVKTTLDQEKNISLGPLYLVWDNFKNKELQGDPIGWPYQIVGIDLIQFADHFPKLAPPPGSSDKVKAGFGDYRKYCIECHSLNGQGGGKAPEISKIVATLDDSFLRKWIDNPRKISPQTTMPVMNSYLRGRDRVSVVQGIIAYLRVMTGTK